MSGFDIEAMRAAVAKATAGPWWIAGKATIRSGDRHWIAKAHWNNAAANAELMRMSHDMAAEIERLDAENSALKADLNHGGFYKESDIDGLDDKIERLTAENARLQKALGLALSRLIESEPGDSRAVSDEFVAMARVEAGLADETSDRIIAAALDPTP